MTSETKAGDLTDEQMEKLRDMISIKCAIEAMAEWLKDERAVNFVAMNVTSDTHGPLEIVVRRNDGKTPTQLLAERDKRIKELEAMLDETLSRE